MNNLLMDFAPCQQLCWRKWSLWSPPGQQEVKDRQRDRRIPSVEAAVPLQGLGGVGGFQTPELPSAQIHGAGRGARIPTKSPFPPLISRNQIIHAEQLLQGGGKVTRGEDWEARAHGQELHHSSSAGPWSSTNPHCNRRQQQHQHPFTSSLHFLAET